MVDESAAIRVGQILGSMLAFPAPALGNRGYLSARMSTSSSHACRAMSASGTPSARYRERDPHHSDRQCPLSSKSEYPSSEKPREMSRDRLLERIPHTAEAPARLLDANAVPPSAKVHHGKRAGLTVATVAEVALRTAAVVPVAVESPAIQSPASPRNSGDPGGIVRKRPPHRRARYMARSCLASQPASARKRIRSC